MDRAEDWHGEDHLNQRADSHKWETEKKLLDESDDEAVGFGDERRWARSGFTVDAIELLN